MQRMPDSPWTLRSAPQPAADTSAALVADPEDGAALLLCDRRDGRADGRGELWRWHRERWQLARAGLLPDDDRFGGPTVAWVEPELGVVLGRLGDEALLRAPLSAPDARTPVFVHGLRSHMGHAFAFGDPDGGAWLLAGASEENHTITWRVQGEVGVEIARGPYLVRVAFDPQARALVGLDVSHRGYRLEASTWRADARLDGELDAIAFDPRRGAIVGLAVRSDARMELVVLGPEGWRPATPTTWLPTYRNQMRLAVDLRTRQLLAFGGQDFDKSGDPSAATWFGEAGELRETVDPAAPPWGRYNTLLTTREALLAFDHSALRLHRREPEGWRCVAALTPEVRHEFDDRFLNVAWTGERLVLLQGEGALLEWRPGDAPRERAPSSSARRPGAAYTHRTALGWDPLGGRAVVGSGDCGRATHVAEAGAWRALTDAQAFSPGDRAAMATTPAGLHALARGGLRLLVGDAWTIVGEDLASGRAAWLGLEPRRGALLAADHAGVWLCTAAGWRALAALPAPMRLGETGGQLGVDPQRDELVLVEGPRLWSAPLAALDWSGADLPTQARPRGRSPRRRAG